MRSNIIDRLSPALISTDRQFSSDTVCVERVTRGGTTSIAVVFIGIAFVSVPDYVESRVEMVTMTTSATASAEIKFNFG